MSYWCTVPMVTLMCPECGSYAQLLVTAYFMDGGLAILLERLRQLSSAIWASGLFCSLLSAFVYSLNGLLVKLLGARVSIRSVGINVIRSCP